MPSTSKKIVIIISCLAFTTCCSTVFASSVIESYNPISGYVKNISSAKPSKITPKTLPINVPKSHKAIPKPTEINFVVEDGSLLPNVKKFAQIFKFHLIWNVTNSDDNAQVDYKWIGTQKITATTPLGILRKMLQPYPVTVNVWQENRVIKIS